jgi:adenine-specific DNA-methyltransferase
LARELLRADGVIFVSIDDNEVHHLRQIMNEIFGEEEFVAQIIWQRAYAPVNMNKYFSPNHDYILCYGKNISEIKNFGLERTDEANARYSNPDNDQRGEWKSGDFSVGPSVESKVYEITTPSGRKVLPPSGRCWRVSKEKFEELKNDNRVWFGDNGNNVPSLKRFLSEVQDKSIPLTVWTYDKVGHSQDAKKQLNDLFDGKAIFDYPKSTTLIKQILSLCTQPNDLILDFFAGSGTTGQAVMELNQEETDKQAKNGLFATPHPNPLPQGEREIVGGRKFILVQLPEKIDHKKEAFKFCQNNNLEPVISNITIERVRRAGEKYKSVDNGFRVFQLTESAINRKLMTKNIAKKEEIFAEIACSYGYGLNYQCCDLHNLGKGITRLEGNNRQALIILGEERIDNQTLAEIVLYSDYSKESQIFAQDACLDVEIIYNLYQHFEQKRVVVV